MILNAQHAAVECRELEALGGKRLRVYQVDNRVGESPVWDAARQCLWWIDVRRPELLRLDPISLRVSRWVLHEPVGALALREDGRLLLALRTHVHLFDLDTARLSEFAAVETDQPLNRLNDGKVSPSGRWWVVGSMDDAAENKQASGGLYRIAADGSVCRLRGGLTVANGIAWSPDAAWLYFSDSWSGQVWRAPWDDSRGQMGEAGLFVSSPEQQGRPDGAVVDAAGDYLSAGVSAACLNRFNAAGALVDCLKLPCRAPTMPCFGGADGQDLFLTSLVRPQWPWQPASPDGQLYRLSDFGGAVAAALMRVTA